MNGVEKDALRLCEFIYDNWLLSEPWTIVNILVSKNPVLTYPTIPQIPTSFGYTYDKVPFLLIRQKVIAAGTPARWYISTFLNIKDVNNRLLLTGKDFITDIAIQKGYFTSSMKACYYIDTSKEELEGRYGPKVKGLYSVLVDRDALISFIRFYKNIYPKLDIEQGSLSFLGEIVKINGALNLKSLELLLRNLNSLVTKKEFYEVDSPNNYEAEVENISQTSMTDKLKKRFKSIQDQIDKNEKLSEAFVFEFRKSGLGIFINNRVLTRTP